MLYRVNWSKVRNPMIRYYNLYYDEEVDPIIDPQHLIVSILPGIGTWLDWNVRAGVIPHYAMTSIDQDGNENEGIPIVVLCEGKSEPAPAEPPLPDRLNQEAKPFPNGPAIEALQQANEFLYKARPIQQPVPAYEPKRKEEEA
jgi:hypothetical protein